MYKKLFALFLLTQSISTYSTVLRSVEHNLSTLTPVPLELGSLKLFFDEIPEVQYIPQRSQCGKHLFFFPHTKKDRLLKEVENKKNEHYTVDIASVTAPIQGTAVTFTFDDNAIQVAHSLFDTIEGRKGVIFRFFNNKLLSQIYDQGKPILQTAAVAS